MNNDTASPDLRAPAQIADSEVEEFTDMNADDFLNLAKAEFLEPSSLVVAILDTSGTIVWTSPAAISFGLDLVGKGVNEILFPEDLPEVTRRFEVIGREEYDGSISLMAHSPIPLRIYSKHGLTTFDSIGGWAEYKGRWWMVVTLFHVSARYSVLHTAYELAQNPEDDGLVILHRGVTSLRGVDGSQILWQDEQGRFKTLGHMGTDWVEVSYRLPELRTLTTHGSAIQVGTSEWGMIYPVVNSGRAIGAIAMWGRGLPPEGRFRTTVVEPLANLVAVTIRRREERTLLENQARTDLTTGLLNRHAFFDVLAGTHERAAVLYLDLDDFKAINDRYGHTIGDRLLAGVGERLVNALAPTDTVARIGGDEFAALLFDLDPDQAENVANRILRRICEPYTFSGTKVVASASIGVAVDSDPSEGELLLDRADQALLISKAKGKGRVVVRNF